MGLTYAEQETIVSMNRAEDVAYVYSADPRVITRLKHNPAAELTEEGVFEGSRWARFTLPAKLIAFKSKVRTLALTDEHKQQARKQLERINAERAAARRAREGLQHGDERDAGDEQAQSGVTH